LFRQAFAFALADVILRYGYLLFLDPGEGCEAVHVGSTTLRHKRVPIWLGSGFTKTQYAAHFVTAHENVCHILDAAREVGLLYRARDPCGFYQQRDWKKAAPIVNAETTFAHVAGRMLSAVVAAAQAAGIPIKEISDPATRNYNLIRVRDEAPPERDPFDADRIEPAASHALSRAVVRRVSPRFQPFPVWTTGHKFSTIHLFFGNLVLAVGRGKALP
jgi:hypothetical protein